MKNLFSDAFINITDEQAENFEKYYQILTEFNEKFNITAIVKKEEVYRKHFIDSLLGEKFLSNGSLLDIGSGGGFPGVPLKIVRPDIKVTLLDATEKKCEFLKTVIEKLDFKDINVLCGRAEELGKKSLRETFDNCTARAVGRLNELAEYSLPFVKKGGKFICYKANAEEELKEAAPAISLLGGQVEEIYKKEFDFGTREIIVIKKIKETPTVYPRSYAKIKKSPLK